MNELEVNNLFQEVKNEIKEIVPFSQSISDIIKITNSKSILGQCAKKGNNFQIKLSKYLLKCDKKLIKETLIHELIHTCPSCFNHGCIFKAYMYKVNNLLGYNICTKCQNDEFKKECEPKYKITCEKCGLVFYRNRLPKRRFGLRHISDNGTLKIEKLY